MNPVTFGVLFTTCHVSSSNSMRTRIYPGKNLRLDVLRSPFTSSTTDSEGIRTSVILSSSPIPRTFSSRATLTLFSYPEYVWTTYHRQATAALLARLKLIDSLTVFNSICTIRGERPITKPKVNRHNHGKYQYNNSGTHSFLSCGESHLLKFDLDFPERTGPLLGKIGYT